MEIYIHTHTYERSLATNNNNNRQSLQWILSYQQPIYPEAQQCSHSWGTKQTPQCTVNQMMCTLSSRPGHELMHTCLCRICPLVFSCQLVENESTWGPWSDATGENTANKLFNTSHQEWTNYVLCIGSPAEMHPYHLHRCLPSQRTALRNTAGSSAMSWQEWCIHQRLPFWFTNATKHKIWMY